MRLFEYRRKHAWAPKIVAGDGWRKTYEDAYATIVDASSVLPSVDEAVVWVNELVSKIDEIGNEVTDGDDKPFYHRQ